MDPITHTLSGVAVAQVLPIEEHRTIATLTVALAANLPDVDALVRRLKSTAFIEYHRVATHSLLGMVVLALLFSAVWAPVTGLTFLTVVFLSVLGCITHTAGDLLIHSDGVPLLYPFVRKGYGLRLLLGLNPTTTSARCGERSLLVCTRCQLHSAALNPVLILFASSVLLGLATDHLRVFSALALLLVPVLLAVVLFMRHLGAGIFRDHVVRTLGSPPRTLGTYPASFLPFKWLCIAEGADGCYLIGRVDLHRKEPVILERQSKHSAHPFVEHSKNADTVRPLLRRSLHPHATAEACKEGVLVKWKDLAYAFDGSVDLFTARLLYSSAGDLLSEEFRERW